MSLFSRSLLSLTIPVLFISGCQTIDLYEKTVNIPGHRWKSSFRPSFTFTISDTTVPYKIFVTLRHRDQYHYNNIYLSLSTRRPGQDSTQTAMYDLKLGTDEEGWRGSGMDDIYEHRIPLVPDGQDFYFKMKGDYTFTIAQAMREDPLEYVMNVGLRIEKK